MYSHMCKWVSIEIKLYLHENEDVSSYVRQTTQFKHISISVYNIIIPRNGGIETSIH